MPATVASPEHRGTSGPLRVTVQQPNPTTPRFIGETCSGTALEARLAWGELRACMYCDCWV